MLGGGGGGAADIVLYIYIYKDFFLRKYVFALAVDEDNYSCLIFTRNSLTPRTTQVSPFTEISILFYEGIIKKIPMSVATMSR